MDSQFKSLSTLFILILAAGSSSCGIVFHDSMWCSSADLSEPAECVHFLTTEVDSMTPSQYQAWLVGSDPASALDPDPAPKVSVDAATFIEWKANLEKMCSFTEVDCSFVSTTQTIKDFLDRLPELSKHVKRVHAARKSLEDLVDDSKPSPAPSPTE